jgi:hypothetical protein
MSLTILNGKPVISKNIMGFGKKSLYPRPPTISAKELALLLNVSVAKLSGLMSAGTKSNNNPPKPRIRSNAGEGCSNTYYDKRETLMWAERAGLLP